MKYDWLIIDGYSLLHREPRLKKYIHKGRLELGRDHLVRLVEESAFEWAERVSVVFDGGSSGGVDLKSTLVDVQFSPGNQTADTVIERLVCGSQQPGKICVVTNDRVELNVVTARGAHGMSCGQFLDLRDQQKRVGRGRNQTIASAKTSFSLGDLFPE